MKINFSLEEAKRLSSFLQDVFCFRYDPHVLNEWYFVEHTFNVDIRVEPRNGFNPNVTINCNNEHERN